MGFYMPEIFHKWAFVGTSNILLQVFPATTVAANQPIDMLQVAPELDLTDFLVAILGKMAPLEVS